MTQFIEKINNDTNYYFAFQLHFDVESNLKYLWAPQKHHNGRVLSHWNMLSKVIKGDYIIHSHNHKIVAISRATTSCYSYNKPNEKGEGNEIGWKVENEYFIFKSPINSNEFKETFLQIQPKNYAPFDKNGSGNRGFIYAANRELFDFIIQKAKLNMDSEELEKLELFLSNNEPNSNIEQIQDLKLNEEIEDILINIQAPRPFNLTPRMRSESIVVNNKSTYSRNKYISAEAIIRANFKCEIDPNHPSFIRRRTKQNYTEPHHLVPMSAQSKFEMTLDSDANIVSLCSNCHNQIHYGADAENLIRVLYEKRKAYLEEIGITISIEELLKIY